ncbi:MAG: DUF262 domain-containing protein [Bacteroidia bacterium]|nr:DUF262 domain-containing protein [Bacteroidia bacterium]
MDSQNEEITPQVGSNTEEDTGDIEKIDESGDITSPFNPNLIKIDTQVLTIQHIVERLEYEEINLNTEFQRQFVWPVEKQSVLIESILLNLPIPTFYFDGQEDNRWQVVDGLQRVSTIKAFVVDKTLRLRGLEFLKDFEEKVMMIFQEIYREGLKVLTLR